MNGKAEGSTHILIAAKEAVGGRRLRAALKSEPGFHFLGQTSEAMDVLTLTRKLKPNILLDSALA